MCVCVCEQVEVGTKDLCLEQTVTRVRRLSACLTLPPSLSLARSLPCVTSESEACWLDLHLIQLVSSISATPKNSRLFSRLHRHLIPGKATPRAADTYTHTHTHTHTYARKHRRARAPDTSGSRCNDKARQGKGVGADVNSISKTKQHKKKKHERSGERAEGRARYKIDGSQCGGHRHKMNLSAYCLQQKT